METLFWIVLGGLVMSAIAMVGGLTTVLRPSVLERMLLPMVALAAGTLLGGAFFHMVPEGMKSLEPLVAFGWLICGFCVFLALEQFLRWHHSHQPPTEVRQPVTYLILIGDAVHNFLGGLAIASTYLLDAKAGVIAWVAAAAHEVPQEIGDFGVLVHGGWPRRKALVWNTLSAMTFPAGAVLAYAASWRFEISGLVLFGAGSFIYVAASDLIPEIKSRGAKPGAMVAHFGFFVAGLVLMFLLAWWFER
jgi:zinc and cadmium transporter